MKPSEMTISTQMLDGIHFTSNLSHVESRFATVGNIMDGTILQEPQAL